eukprot:8774492-Ditylum_brightwellii.AAC.1
MLNCFWAEQHFNQWNRISIALDGLAVIVPWVGPCALLLSVTMGGNLALRCGCYHVSDDGGQREDGAIVEFFVIFVAEVEVSRRAAVHLLL